MGKEQEESISSFVCYNCNEKNFFDIRKYVHLREGEMPSEKKSSENKVLVVSIQCKSCRESNSVTIIV